MASTPRRSGDDYGGSLRRQGGKGVGGEVVVEEAEAEAEAEALGEIE